MLIVAGEIKSNYKLSLADAVAISLAKVKDGILLTSDHHELDIIEKNRIINVEWVR